MTNQPANIKFQCKFTPNQTDEHFPVRPSDLPAFISKLNLWVGSPRSVTSNFIFQKIQYQARVGSFGHQGNNGRALLLETVTQLSALLTVVGILTTLTPLFPYSTTVSYHTSCPDRAGGCDGRVTYIVIRACSSWTLMGTDNRHCAGGAVTPEAWSRPPRHVHLVQKNLLCV